MYNIYCNNIIRLSRHEKSQSPNKIGIMHILKNWPENKTFIIYFLYSSVKIIIML